MRVRLQEQPFLVLLTLLEFHGEVVSKETLRSRLWPDDRFVEVDVSLSVAVAKLREALGDEASNPRFIETIPRRGYRFLAQLSVLQLPTPAIAVESRQSPPLTGERATRPAGSPRSVSVKVIVAVGSALAFIVAGAIVYRHFKTTPAADGIESVIVAEFTNTTGDPIFDETLRRATIVQISQSPSFEVFSDASIDDALQGLGRPPARGQITAEVARQACQPLEAESILSGSVSRQGMDHFNVSVEANRCGDGKRLSGESAQVVGRDQVIDALGRVLVDMRHDLGESRSSLKQFNVQIGQATTDSLEALNAYRVGSDLRANGRPMDAVPFFKAAVVLDPRFAMAYEQMGSAYSNIGEAATGAIYIQKAFNARDRATEPERYMISGRYFDIVTGELEKALSIYRLWQATYPREWSAANGLANDSNLLGRYETAVASAREAIRLQPNHTFGYSNLAIALMAMNRFGETEKVCDDRIAKGRGDSILLRIKFQLAYMSGDEKRIAETARAVGEGPDYDEVIASVAMAEGRLAEARKILEKSNDVARAEGLPGVGAQMLGAEAVLLAQFGEAAEAKRIARASISSDAGEPGYGNAMIALATVGNADELAAVERRLDHAYPLSVFNMGFYRPVAEGLLSAARHEPAERVKAMMAPALPYELGQIADLIPLYARGQALLDTGAVADAQHEFQKLLDHRGVDPASPYLSMAHLGLGRAFNIQGQRDSSCEEYREFLRLWAHADAEIPLLREAKQEARAEHCEATH